MQLAISLISSAHLYPCRSHCLLSCQHLASPWICNCTAISIGIYHHLHQPPPLLQSTQYIHNLSSTAPHMHVGLHRVLDSRVLQHLVQSIPRPCKHNILCAKALSRAQVIASISHIGNSKAAGFTSASSEILVVHLQNLPLAHVDRACPTCMVVMWRHMQLPLR